MFSLYSHILDSRTGKTFIYLLGLVLIAILFQVGHFAEHIIQVVAWIFGYRHEAYMTPSGMWLMHWLGVTLFPGETHDRQHLMGFEMLHLLGNTIFLFGTLGLLYFTRAKQMVWAGIIQTFHFLEHVSLSASAYFINKSIGLSTLYGMPMDQFAYVAYRVWWHFFMNAIPTVIVLYTLWYIYKKNKAQNTGT